MISLDLLRTLVSYTETRNVTTTADALGLSQPAVSGHLQRLSDELNLPLFLAKGRTKAVTPFGAALAEACREPLLQVERAVERTRVMFCQGEKLTLRIGARREIMPRIVGLISFVGKLVYQNMASEESLGLLSSGQLDLVVVQNPPSSFFIRPLFADDVTLVIAKGRLGKRQPTFQSLVSPAFLASTPYLAYRSNSPFVREVAIAVELSPREIQTAAVCEDWLGILAMVGAGLGYSIVPTSLAERDSSVARIPIPHHIVPKITFYLVARKELMLVPSIKNGLTFLEDRL